MVNRLIPYYERPSTDRALVDSAVLALIVRSAEAAPKEALSLAGQLPDTLLREDALWLIGARCTLTGRARTVLDEFNPRSFPKGAGLSFYRGCVEAAPKISPN